MLGESQLVVQDMGCMKLQFSVKSMIFAHCLAEEYHQVISMYSIAIIYSKNENAIIINMFG